MIDDVLGLYPNLERQDLFATLAHATWRTEEVADSPARGYTRY